MAGLNTVAKLGGYIGTYLNQMALPIFHENTIFDRAIDSMYTIPNNETNEMTWYIPTKMSEFDELAAEGVTPDGQDYTQSTITKTLHWYGSWSGTTDIVKLQYNTPVIQNIDTELLHAAQKTYDSLIRVEALTTTNLGGASSNALIGSYAGTIASVGGQLTIGTFREVSQLLLEAGAETYYNFEMGSARVGSSAAWNAYLCIAPVQMRGSILTMTGFLEAKDYSNGSPAAYELGAVDMFRVFYTDNAATSLGASANGLNVYPIFFFGRKAMGGVKIGGGGMMTYFDDFGTGSDILRQRCALGRKFQAANKILNDSWMFVMYAEQYV